MSRLSVFTSLLALVCLVGICEGQSIESICHRVRRNPAPKDKICGKYGTLKNPQNYATLGMPTQSGSAGFDFYWEYCADQCQEYYSDEPCGSFSINIEAETCKLYKQDLSKGFTKKQANSGPYFYDNACAKYSCRTSAVQQLTNPYSQTNYDDERWLVTIPFMLQFGSNSYNKIWISMNGFVSFGEANQPGSAYTNAAFPTSNLPPASLAVYWDDLAASVIGDSLYNTPFAQQVTYSYSTTQFSVTWDLRNRDVSGGYIRAQLYLYGNLGYGVMLYNFVDNANGSTATVGSQRDGNSYTWSFNTAKIPSGLSLFINQNTGIICDDDSCI